MRRSAFILLALAAMLALGACNDQPAPDARDRDAAATAALPAPAYASGGVTGMPDRPGPGEVPLAGAPPAPDPWLAPDARFGLPPLEDNPETGLIGVEDPVSAAAATAEPDADAAVAVIRDYYAAIGARDYARAYALWSDGGRASGQAPERFAAGFAQTAEVSVKTGDPGRVEGAAGSRYVEVPVSVSARQSDGSARRYVGSYTLRRAVADGASEEQRAWRIHAAQLRELQP